MRVSKKHSLFGVLFKYGFYSLPFGTGDGKYYPRPLGWTCRQCAVLVSSVSAISFWHLSLSASLHLINKAWAAVHTIFDPQLYVHWDQQKSHSGQRGGYLLVAFPAWQGCILSLLDICLVLSWLVQIYHNRGMSSRFPQEMDTNFQGHSFFVS